MTHVNTGKRWIKMLVELIVSLCMSTHSYQDQPYAKTICQQMDIMGTKVYHSELACGGPLPDDDSSDDIGPGGCYSV